MATIPPTTPPAMGPAEAEVVLSDFAVALAATSVCDEVEEEVVVAVGRTRGGFVVVEEMVSTMSSTVLVRGGGGADSVDLSSSLVTGREEGVEVAGGGGSEVVDDGVLEAGGGLGRSDVTVTGGARVEDGSSDAVTVTWARVVVEGDGGGEAEAVAEEGLSV